MKIKKKYWLIIIGVFLISQTYSNITRMTPNNFQSGSTIMEYNITKQVDIDEIKNIIYKNANIEKDDIIINIEEERKMRIEFAYVDIEIAKELDEIIERNFVDSIEILNVTSIGPLELSSKFVIIFSILCIVFVIGAVLFAKGLFLLIKE